MFGYRELKSYEQFYAKPFIRLKSKYLNKVGALSTNSVLTYLRVQEGHEDYSTLRSMKTALVYALSSNTTLTRLDLSTCTIEYKDLRILSRNTTLTSLNLSNHSLWRRLLDPDEGLLAIMPSLTYLDLNENITSPEEAQLLANHSGLTHLCLFKNLIGNKGASVLIANTILTHLNLGGNNINAQGLAGLANNTTLTHLDLSHNAIKDKGVKTFYPSNTTLRELFLTNTDIEDESAKILAISNNSLTALKVDENDFGPLGNKALLTSTIIRSLALAHELTTEDLQLLDNNTTLTYLTHPVDLEPDQKLLLPRSSSILLRNLSALMTRGQNLLRFLIIMAKDKYKPYDIRQSLLAQLPLEIISLIVSDLHNDIGKERQETSDFVTFFFGHVSTFLKSLIDGKKEYIIERSSKKFRLDLVSDEDNCASEEANLAIPDENSTSSDMDNSDSSSFMSDDESEQENRVDSQHSTVSKLPPISSNESLNSNSLTATANNKILDIDGAPSKKLNTMEGTSSSQEQSVKESYAAISQLLRMSGESKVESEKENKNNESENLIEFHNNLNITRSHPINPLINDENEVNTTGLGFSKK